MATTAPEQKLVLDDASLRKLLIDLQMRFVFSGIPFSDNPEADLVYLLEIMENKPLIFNSYIPCFKGENN